MRITLKEKIEMCEEHIFKIEKLLDKVITWHNFKRIV
jgi:hypothetical protein